ncbi:HepT-like ribonuclease domain-containing protein [Leptothoe sp. ISB3NOV94-8A]
MEPLSAGLSLAEFAEAEDEQLLILKNIEIIGEAVKSIPQEVREQYTQIPWKQIVGMRDRLVHQYWNVDVELVWDTMQTDLPLLKAVITQIREEYGN